MITLRFDNRCTCRLNLPPNFAVFFQARKMCPGKSQKTLRAPGWQKIRTAIITFCLAPGKANRNRQSGVKMGNSSRRGRGVCLFNGFHARFECVPLVGLSAPGLSTAPRLSCGISDLCAFG